MEVSCLALISVNEKTIFSTVHIEILFEALRKKKKKRKERKRKKIKNLEPIN